MIIVLLVIVRVQWDITCVVGAPFMADRVLRTDTVYCLPLQEVHRVLSEPALAQPLWRFYRYLKPGLTLETVAT